MTAVGIDLVDVGRFRRVLERRAGIAARLFTEGELAYADISSAANAAGRLAARFAAKEAAMKVLGVGLGAVRFRDIEVRRASSGEPALVLHGRAHELARERRLLEWNVSLSHTASTAAAVVVAE